MAGTETVDYTLSPDPGSHVVVVMDGAGHVRVLRFPGSDAITGTSPDYSVTFRTDHSGTYDVTVNAEMQEQQTFVVVVP